MLKTSKYGLFIALLLSSQALYADDLIAIYQQAVVAAPQLKNAETKVNIGEDLKGQAFGQMLPQINASGNWSKNEQSFNSRNTRYTGTRYFISLNQPLLDFSKFWEWKRAAQVEDQYAAEATQAHHQLMFDVVERYFNVLEAEDQLKFVKTEKQSFEKQLEQIQKKYAKQLLKITDLYAAEARIDQLSAEALMIEAKLITLKENIAELTGNAPKTLSPLNDTIEYAEIEGELQQWVEMAKIQSPAISAKQMAISAAQNNVKAQKTKHLPVVDLQLNYYDTNTGFQSSNLGTDTQTTVAAINVNIPIYSGGTTTHQVHEAQHRLALSENDREAITRTVVKETSSAFYAANAGVRQIQSLQIALKSASKSRESMERGYQLGVVTISDVIKSQQEEFSVKKDIAQAKYNYIINRAKFMHAIGSINQDNLLEINHWLVKTDSSSQ